MAVAAGAIGVAGGQERGLGSFLRIVGLGLFCYVRQRTFFGRFLSTLRLQFAELGGAAMEDAVRLSPGTVDRDLDFFGRLAGGFHGVMDDAVVHIEWAY